MRHSLSDAQIARLVGDKTFARGLHYALMGNVGQLSWNEAGTRLYGRVAGSRSTTYSTAVLFKRDTAGELTDPSGSCSCPVGVDCKHVAAMLVESRDVFGVTSSTAQTPSRDGAVQPARAATTQRTPTQPATRHPAAAPAPAQPAANWQKALAPLVNKPATAHSTGAPFALQIELLPPLRKNRASNSNSRSLRLGARPMTVGKNGKWIRNNLTWDNLAYARGYLNQTQRKVLGRIHDQYSVGRGYFYLADQWLPLDSFPTRVLWDLLDEAREAGIVLISSNRLQDPVVLADSAVELSLDISRTASGLGLKPTLALDGDPLDPTRLILLGDPPHGVASWTGSAVTPGSGEVPVEYLLTLAPLAAPIGAEIRDLAAAETALLVPAAEESLFLANYYPFLRNQLTLTSLDESFELTAAPRPVLALDITGGADGLIELNWQWHYVAPDAAADATADFTHSLRSETADTGYRDTTREAEILHAVGGILTRFPTLAHPSAPHRLTAHAVLTGARMIEFLTAEVAILNTIEDVLVLVGEIPEYREADEAPLITVATHERPDDRDWFDLAVDVSVDGQAIPFDELFRALATEQELMILPDGVWFSLDRPELHQLRRLIEEARGLQDHSGPTLGISRFQADLWDELQELGVVTAQAAAWRDAVAGLTLGAEITPRPLPDSVHATLRGYQQDGFEWLSFLYDQGLGGVLADDMGLGKTLQAISLIAHTRQQPAIETSGTPATPAPFLVVAPTSVVPNWAAECAKFAPSLNVVSITETSTKRGAPIAELLAGADVVITSYTLFRLDFDEYNAEQWAGLLLDEAQFVKNHQSRAHQCARRLNTPFKLAITGTPMENNLMELWSLFSITAPGLFPSPSKFADFYQKSIEKEADGERLTQLRRRIRPFMLRRTKGQVATDLPAKQEQVLELELHPKHRKVYQTHLQRERQKVLGLIDDMNANRFEIFRSLTMLRQLSLDASLYDEKYANIPSTKLDALMELLDDTVAEGHRTLIFSQFTGYLAKARTRLDAAGVSYSYLDGKTRNRAKTIEEFKNGTNPVFLISLKAGGFGLNLTEADYVILLDPWWNPATEAQAVDRTHRIGQTKNVMVYRLVSKDTIEEKVMALKATKAKLFDSVMTDGAAPGAKFTAADIRELLA